MNRSEVVNEILEVMRLARENRLYSSERLKWVKEQLGNWIGLKSEICYFNLNMASLDQLDKEIQDHIDKLDGTTTTFVPAESNKKRRWHLLF